MQCFNLNLNPTSMIYFTRTFSILSFLLASSFFCSAQNKYVVINSTPGLTRVDLHDTSIVAPFGGYGQYSLDLDKNGVTDLFFSAGFFSSGSGGSKANVVLTASDNCLFSINSGRVYVVKSTKDTSIVTAPIVKIFNSLDTIYSDSCKTGANTTFVEHSNPASLSYSVYINEWIKGVHYVGINKTINNVTYTGWVELEVTGYLSIRLKSYSIQELPVGITELAKTAASIYPNPANDKLYIKDIVCSRIDIYNAAGSLVATLENRNNGSLFSMDIANLSKGLYTLKIQEQGSQQYFTTKIVKQ